MTRRRPQTSQVSIRDAHIFFPYAIHWAKISIAAEDEIDWDEDEKPTTAPAAAAVAAGGLGSVANPTTVPNQKVDLDPSTTTDLKVTKADDGASAEKTTEAPQAPAPEVKKQDFAIGIAQTDAEKEIAKRRARAEKFGMPVDDEAKKLARAAKFGVDSAATVVRGFVHLSHYIQD